MEVYVTYSDFGKFEIYDSLLSVKMDYHTGNDDMFSLDKTWAEIEKMSLQEFREYLEEAYDTSLHKRNVVSYITDPMVQPKVSIPTPIITML